MPKPPTWRAKSQAARLGYNDIWESLAEKFHCTRAYLKALNHDVKQPVAGSEIIGPKVVPAAPYPRAASLRVNLGETSIEALDGSEKVIAFFPCSIAADKNKRPNGTLTVKSVVPNPDYTFDPGLFKAAAASEGITHKMTLPPGPRNPVGTAWIGLSLPPRLRHPRHARAGEHLPHAVRTRCLREETSALLGELERRNKETDLPCSEDPGPRRNNDAVDVEPLGDRGHLAAHGLSNEKRICSQKKLVQNRWPPSGR